MNNDHRIGNQAAGASLVDRLCPLFLILSGMAAVTYQVVWVRLLGLSMGSTSASVGTVLAAFFLGMSLGSYLAGRVMARFGVVLGLYAAIELLIGAIALLLLPVLVHLDRVMAVLGPMGELLPVKFLIALLLLAVPSTCIGATFPVMAAFVVRRGGRVGANLGVLYSVNTLGAVLGAGLSGFLFIPAAGLDGAVFLGVAANLAVAAMARGLMRMEVEGHGAPPEPASVEDTRDASAGDGSGAAVPLAILALTGFTSIASEVGYTKYLSIYMGTTIYGFSAILAVFLAGIALGSWWIRRRIDGIGHPDIWVVSILLLLGAGMAAARSALGLLPSFAGSGILLRLPAVLAILLPPTFLLGALFPLNLHMVCSRAGTVRQKAGMAYAVNTLGSIGGSLAAGFVLIPRLGTDVLLASMAVLTGAGALLFVRALPTRQALLMSGGVLVVAAGCLLLPRLDYAAMLRVGGGLFSVKGDIVELIEGKTAVVSVSKGDGKSLYLHNNGLPQAAINRADPTVGPRFGVFLGAVVYALHPDPKTAFVVGFGGGVVSHALAASELRSVRVVELEPAVVRAVEAVHGGHMALRDDPRVSLEINDARNVLLLSPNTYDLIVSQPSHPWVAGASAVFTEEFFRLAASRLNPGGLFSQWVTMVNLNERAFRSILQAFYRVFPHGMVFASDVRRSKSVYLVGSNQPLDVDRARINARLAAPEVVAGPIGRYMHDAGDVFAYYLLSRDEAVALAGDVPANTDLNVLSEVSQPYLRPPGSPYELVARHVGFAGVDQTFGPDAAWVLWRAGAFLVQDGNYPLAEVAAERLASHAPVLADALRCEVLLANFYYGEALDRCGREDAWPEPLRVPMAAALLEMRRHDEAAPWISAIADPKTRGQLEAWRLYEAGQWDGLLARSPLSARERAWILLAAARTDPAAAAEEMAAIAGETPGALMIPHLRFLAEYQARTGRLDTLDAVALLNQRIRQLTGQFNRLAVVAQENNDEQRLQFLSWLHRQRLYLPE